MWMAMMHMRMLLILIMLCFKITRPSSIICLLVSDPTPKAYARAFFPSVELVAQLRFWYFVWPDSSKLSSVLAVWSRHARRDSLGSSRKPRRGVVKSLMWTLSRTLAFGSALGRADITYKEFCELSHADAAKLLCEHIAARYRA
ncbi:hypothetical protein F5141DRAFT_592442 [Pisolithus sp. B1]|nr:hypothetical protein F5141DRAFT_592442 [Pisolithus sp. B1]